MYGIWGVEDEESRILPTGAGIIYISLQTTIAFDELFRFHRIIQHTKLPQIFIFSLWSCTYGYIDLKTKISLSNLQSSLFKLILPFVLPFIKLPSFCHEVAPALHKACCDLIIAPELQCVCRMLFRKPLGYPKTIHVSHG